MKNLTKILILSIAVFSLTGCSKKIFEAKEFKVLKRKHQTIAVLPAMIDMAGKSKHSAESSLKNVSMEKSYDFQKALIKDLQSEQENYSVSILPKEETNQKLEENYIKFFDLKRTEVSKIGDALRVDGLLYTEIESSIILGKNPGSDSKEEVHVKVTLKEANNERVMWSYEDDYKAKNTYTIEAIEGEIFKKIKGKFPYK
jgi:hypothetical protein